MKRITVYNEKNEILFVGNLNDLPLDENEAMREARERYGDRLCPQRYASVKEALLSTLFSDGSKEVFIPDSVRRLLRDKNAVRIIVRES